MSEKTIQQRLREVGYRQDNARTPLGGLLREAAALIDRLTVAPSEDVVERVRSELERKQLQLVEYQHGIAGDDENPALRHAYTIAEGRLLQIAQDIAALDTARAAIAAMPSEEALRRDEREKCIAEINTVAELRGRQECCGVGEYSGTGGPPECCAKPLLMIETNEAIAAIRARNEEK